MLVFFAVSVLGRTIALPLSRAIGVCLVGFITILASSTSASANATVDRTFTGDFVINSGMGCITYDTIIGDCERIQG